MKHGGASPSLRPDTLAWPLPLRTVTLDPIDPSGSRVSWAA
jgi:hypothetical protein